MCPHCIAMVGAGVLASVPALKFIVLPKLHRKKKEAQNGQEAETR